MTFHIPFRSQFKVKYLKLKITSDVTRRTLFGGRDDDDDDGGRKRKIRTESTRSA